MSLASACVMVLFGGIAGWIGWRRSTRMVYRRSIFDVEPPPGTNRREHERATRRRRKLLRLAVTLLYALGGALLGAVIMMSFKHG